MTYKVLGDKDIHEFNLVTEDLSDRNTRYSLFASDNPIWTEHTRGTLYFSLIDDGNKLIFDKKLKTLDYGDMNALRIIINFITFDQPNQTPTKIITETLITEF